MVAKQDILAANVSLAKAVTTKVEINVNHATVIPTDDQRFHATLLANVIVKVDILEANVDPALVSTNDQDQIASKKH